MDQNIDLLQNLCACEKCLLTCVNYTLIVSKAIRFLSSTSKLFRLRQKRVAERIKCSHCGVGFLRYRVIQDSFFHCHTLIFGFVKII